MTTTPYRPAPCASCDAVRAEALVRRAYLLTIAGERRS